MSDFAPDTEFEANDWSGPSRFTNPLTVAWQRKTIVLLGLAFGLVAGVLYYAQKTPTYQSTAQVLVVKKRADAMPMAMGTNVQQAYFEDYVTTHTILIRSQLILRRAAQDLQANTPEVIPADADPVTLIATGLTVTKETRDGATAPSNVINLAFRGSRPDHCSIILNAVINAYQGFLSDTYGDLSEKFVDQMKKAQKTLQSDILGLEAEYEVEVAKDPITAKDKEGLASILDRISKLEAKRAELILRRTELNTRKETIEKALKGGQSRTAVLKVLEKGNPTKLITTDGRSPEEILVSLQLQEEEMAQDYGKDHPQLVALRRRMQLLRDRVSLQNVTTTEPIGDPLALHEQMLDSELDENDMQQKTLTTIVEKERGRAQEIAKFQLGVDRVRKKIDPTRQLYDSIVAQLQQYSLKGSDGGYTAKTIVEPGPGNKVSPLLVQTLGFTGVLGLLAGLGLAYAAAWTDKTFHSPDEIRRRLGVNVIGHMPSLNEDQTVTVKGLDPHLIAAHAPRSMQSEAFRGLRTALYFSIQGRTHKVLQITSPHKGDGKSTLAANLAISIAQSGKSVVLIDADFRRPKIHRYFEMGDPTVGLASVINGETELLDAIVSSPVPNLSLLPCGPRPANPAELLTLPRFQDLLKVIREKFDFVLIDTPPLLVVSDPAVVAPRVDGVILTLKITKNCRLAAERARELLSTLGVTPLGVVVNGFDGQGGGSHFGYGYDYGYDYRSGYGYARAKYEGYGEGDEDEEEAALTAPEKRL